MLREIKKKIKDKEIRIYRKSRKFMKILSITGFLLLLLLLCIEYIDIQEAQAKDDQFDNESRPYRVEKRILEREKKEKELAFQNLKVPKAAVQVVFTELDAEVYEACAPKLVNNDMTGVLGLSLEELPGQPGNITQTEFQEMIDLGFTICAVYSGSTNLEIWWSELKTQLTMRNIDIPTTICISENIYDESLDSIIKNLGFQIVLNKNTDWQLNLQTKDENGLWHLEGIGLKTQQSRVIFKNAVDKQASLTVFIGFSKDDEKYNAESYRNLIRDLWENCVTEKLIVGSFRDARAHFKYRVLEITKEEKKKHKDEINILELEIAETEGILDEIVNDYYSSW